MKLWISFSLALGLLLVLHLSGQASAGKKHKRTKGNKNWRMAKCRKMMSPMQESISELERKVREISNPVHIHLHSDADVVYTPATGEQAMADDTAEQGQHGSHHKHHKHSKHSHSMDGGRKHNGHKSHNSRHSSRKSSEEEEEEEEEGDEETPMRQSHVHIHLNMGANLQQSQGQGHGCPSLDSSYPKDEYIYAICEMKSNPAVRSIHNVRGAVALRQKPNQALEVKVNLYGFNTRASPSNQKEQKWHHGFHVHEFGDSQKGCNSFGGHYNPGGHAHGGPESEHKHTGDWGNIEANNKGVVVTAFNQTGFLYGPESLMGRGIVVHAQADDHGKGGTHSSHTTGSAGARIACCIISHYNGDNW